MITKTHAEGIIQYLTTDAPESLDLASVKQTALDLAAEVVRRASRPARIFKAELVVPVERPEGQARERRTYLVAARSETRAEAKVIASLPQQTQDVLADDFDGEYPVTVTEVANPYLASTGAEG